MNKRILTALAVTACLISGCTGADSQEGARSEEAAATEAVTMDESATDTTGTVLGESMGEGAGAAAGSDDAAQLQAEAAPDAASPASEVSEPASSGEGEGGGSAGVSRERDEDADEEPAAGGAVSPSGLSVVRAYVCKGIEQSEPTEAGKSFIPEDDGVLRLCCFSEIAGASSPDTIYHVWRWGEREMARVPLEVKSARWRTWSSKRILDEWRGEWHVEIVDSDGFRLQRLDFSVE